MSARAATSLWQSLRTDRCTRSAMRSTTSTGLGTEPTTTTSTPTSTSCRGTSWTPSSPATSSASAFAPCTAARTTPSGWTRPAMCIRGAGTRAACWATACTTTPRSPPESRASAAMWVAKSSGWRQAPSTCWCWPRPSATPGPGDSRRPTLLYRMRPRLASSWIATCSARAGRSACPATRPCWRPAATTSEASSSLRRRIAMSGSPCGCRWAALVRPPRRSCWSTSTRTPRPRPAIPASDCSSSAWPRSSW
mmetsp:Transcript_18906/g.26034  ORF Transcript_18906/g.26034 Transcript_18906/m.26034 type:complete len:251 (+) Transcript_18906:1241-1993(+)